ncbi:hypothetical protein LWI29_019560 [Acer saccharum]|uniref:Uncharacterized protein n=1 Tax=Acer saccharum TaxID=4024 RepID=A0AA39SME3_ACESA|nr:hypothetical protein LWI29_019560 [Acer saccharum]
MEGENDHDQSCKIMQKEVDVRKLDADDKQQFIERSFKGAEQDDDAVVEEDVGDKAASDKAVAQEDVDGKAAIEEDVEEVGGAEGSSTSGFEDMGMVFGAGLEEGEFRSPKGVIKKDNTKEGKAGLSGKDLLRTTELVSIPD